MEMDDRSGPHPVDRLNETERDVLRLLGQGHTAKSIASLRGLSVAAVNERLRAGRRKTGVGSSRELARLLAAQENRDDFIGLAEAPAPTPGFPRPDATPARRASPLRRWSLPMIAAAAIVAAALLGQQTATTPAVWSDGLVAEILSRQPAQPDLAALHARVMNGERDTLWSPDAEMLLAQRYRAVPDFGRDVPTVSVRCSADLCEVAGIMRAGINGDDLTAMMLHLQTLGHPTPLRADLEQLLHQFSTADERPPAFVSYWSRQTDN